MKRVLTILMALIFTSAAWAQQVQQEQSTSFTLEQCIQFALENSIAAKNAELDQRIAKARVNETVGIGLPQVSGTVSLVDNPTLSRFYGTYVENPTGGISFFPTGLPNAKTGDVLAQKNFFQLPSSGTATLAINQIIFNGSYLVGLKASSTYKELSLKTADQTDQEIILQVTKAYYGVLINKARKNLFDDNIARVDSLLRNTSALNENGFAESIDVDRVKVTLNNLRTERDKFLNLDNLGIQLLKFQMNYPQEKPMDVAGDIKDVVVDASQLDKYTDNIDYAQRPDYRVLEVNKRLQELNVKNQYAASIPSLSFFANLGYSTQSNNVSGLFKTNSKVVDGQYGEVVVGPDKWYPNTQFGINLNVPLFSGLQRNYKVQQEKLKLLQINNNFTSLKNAINLEVTQALVNYDNAVKSLESQKENQQLASNIARVTKIKYEQGVGSSLEVTDAENALRTAQTNYYAALYDAMVAKVDLDKAYGRLLPAATTTNSK